MTTPSKHEIKSRLQSMDPYTFEELVAELWEVQGYEIFVRKGSQDRGIDVEAVKEDPISQKILIQAKRYSDENKIGSNEVRKYATLYQQVADADTVVIATTGFFTQEAEQLARDLNVKIVDGEALSRLIIDYLDEIDTIQIQSNDSDHHSTSKGKNRQSKISTSSTKSEKKDVYPWFDYSINRWEVPCPYCNKGPIHNHKDSFIEHWKEADHCDGPKARPPSRLNISEEDWKEILEEIYQDPPTEDNSSSRKFSDLEGQEDSKCESCYSGEINWNDSKSIGECDTCGKEYKYERGKWFPISQN